MRGTGKPACARFHFSPVKMILSSGDNCPDVLLSSPMNWYRIALPGIFLLLAGCLFSVSRPSDDSGVARLDIHAEKQEAREILEARIDEILDRNGRVVFRQANAGMFTRSVDLPPGRYTVKAICRRKHGFDTAVRIELDVQEGDLIVMDPYWVDPEELRYVGHLRKRVCGIHFNRG